MCLKNNILRKTIKANSQSVFLVKKLIVIYKINIGHLYIL